MSVNLLCDLRGSVGSSSFPKALRLCLDYLANLVAHILR